MSQFSQAHVACPGCGDAVPFEAVHSVNGERAPHLRQEILDETFQRMACPACAADFRLEPDFNYVDHAEKLWIAVLPLHLMSEWTLQEQRAADLFKKVYVEGSPYLRGLAPTLRKRIVFGWAALREKLLIDDLGLDDVTLELVKSALIRSSEEAPLGQDSELRLVAGTTDELTFAWMDSQGEDLEELLSIERREYAALAADPEGRWTELRDDIAAGSFVDLNRLLAMPTAPHP